MRKKLGMTVDEVIKSLQSIKRKAKKCGIDAGTKRVVINIKMVCSAYIDNINGAGYKDDGTEWSYGAWISGVGYTYGDSGNWDK